VELRHNPSFSIYLARSFITPGPYQIFKKDKYQDLFLIVRGFFFTSRNKFFNMKPSLSLAAIAAYVPLSFGLAFPGAEGFGRNAVGGRGGTVYVVTNLNDSGAGSLRDAVSAKNRIVVFAVGGLIQITDRIVCSSHITILGQTAPGGGITVYGNGWSFSDANETIVRYLRIRMGKGGTDGKDAITIASGDNMIFDHLSVSWGRDETFSINGDATNITIQNSIIGQGLETHSCGGLMQTDGGVSLFRNLYIDNKTRNPKVKGVNDFTNNVVYNCKFHCSSPENQY
jgi:pectate lyase